MENIRKDVENIRKDVEEVKKDVEDVKRDVEDVKKGKENAKKENNIKISQLILLWIKRNFTATAIGLFLTIAFGVFSIYVYYKPVVDVFTATIEVYGWEGEHHNPLDGKGALVLTLEEKSEKAIINQQGEAVFVGLPSKYDGETVVVYLTDTEGEPYFLPDSIIEIHKTGVTKVQVRLRGLDRLEGQIFDETGIDGLPGVKIRVAEQTTTTDEWGHFSVEIPRDKMKRNQLIEVKKEGYEPESYANFDMTGKFEKKLKKQE